MSKKNKIMQNNQKTKTLEFIYKQNRIMARINLKSKSKNRYPKKPKKSSRKLNKIINQYTKKYTNIQTSKYSLQPRNVYIKVQFIQFINAKNFFRS